MESTLEKVISSRPVGTLVYKYGENVYFANEIICNEFGHKKKDMEKLLLSDIIYPGDFEVFTKNAIKILSNQAHHISLKIRFVKKNMNLLSARIVMKKYVTENLHQLLVLTFESVEELKDSSKKTGDSVNIEVILSKLDHLDSTGVIIGKPGANFLYLNEMFAKEFGYSVKKPEEVKGLGLVPSSEYKRFLKIFIQIYSGLKKKVDLKKGKFLTKQGGLLQANASIFKQKVGGLTYFIMQFDHVMKAQ